MLVSRLMECLNREGLSLENNLESRNGRAIAFVVHSGRLKVDIDRDLQNGEGYSVFMMTSPNFDNFSSQIVSNSAGPDPANIQS